MNQAEKSRNGTSNPVLTPSKKCPSAVFQLLVYGLNVSTPFSDLCTSPMGLSMF